jgi:hypothetical protein
MILRGSLALRVAASMTNPVAGGSMNLNVNVVVQSGLVKWPALRYDPGSRPEFRFVLYRETQNADDQTFALSIPCCAVSSTAERLASEMDEGDFVVITVGELCYRKRQTRAGEVSRLEILVWRVQKGEPALAGASVVAETSPEPADDPPARAESKKGRPCYPRWKPAPADSSN